MDISSRFSLTDFLAYLFPGVFATAGLYLLLLLTPLETLLANLPTDLTAGILFLVLSYVMGVVVSGVAEILTHKIRHKNDGRLPQPLVGFEKDIKNAFFVVFGGSKDFDWSRTHFYLCRSIVTQYMPDETPGIQRQSSLRQLRMNMLPSIIVWAFAGIGWGWKICSDQSELWGIGLIVFSIACGIVIFRIMLDRMQNNDEREVRETIAAFLVGHKTGLFKTKSKTPTKKEE